MKGLIFIYDTFRKYPLLTGRAVLCLFLANILDAASVFSLLVAVSLFIDPGLNNISPLNARIIGMLRQAGFPVGLGWVLFMFLLFNFLKAGFQIFAQHTILRTKYVVLRDMMLGTFGDFFSARWQFFSGSRQGVFLNTFIREINNVGEAFGAVVRYFSGILQVVLYLVVPFVISWQVSAATFGAALLFALPFILLGKLSYRLGRFNTSTANQVGVVLQENLSLAKVVLGFGNQRKSQRMLSRAFDAHRAVTIKSQTLSFSLPRLYLPVGLIVLCFGVISARRVALSLADTMVLFYAIAKIIPAIGMLTEEKAYMENFFPSYEQVNGLRESARALAQPTGSRQFSGFSREVRLEAASFSYPGQAAIICAATLRFPKGKMTAIVGESGSGKSTLIDMVMGFNQPQEGDVLVDGISLREFEINSFRACLGYVPQDSVLFNVSIKENLLWAKEDATDAQINAACRAANAEEFILRLPEGYDTVVGDRGARLSGGQVQRLALARAVLRRPQILVLDEATSALDTHSERLIQQAVENIAKETTVIAVAHRLSTIMNADYIYVIKDGRVAEEGGYAQLMRQQGIFNRMAKLQALGLTV